MYKTSRSPFLRENYHPDTQSRPIQLEIINVFVNNICNAQCSYCHMSMNTSYAEENETFREMSLETLSHIIANAKDTPTINTICLVGKEPSLWKHLEQGIKMIKDAGFKCIIATNGLMKREIEPDEIELHLDKEFLEKNTLHLKYWHTLCKEKKILLSFVIVVNREPNTDDIDFYYDIVKRYGCYRVSVSQETPDIFGVRGKISVNKAIFLYKKLLHLKESGHSPAIHVPNFGKPIPYCLIQKDNYAFLEKNSLPHSAGTCQSGGYEIIIDIDGKTSYPCIGLLNKKFELPGNYQKAWEVYFEYLDGLRRKMPKSECYDCEWYKNHLCHAGCLDRHIS